MATTKPLPVPDSKVEAKTTRAWLAGIPDSAGYAFFISFLALVVGLLGSLWTDEIKESFPISGIRTFPQDINRHALLFWAMALAWGYLFWLRERLKSQKISALNVQVKKFEAQALELVGGVDDLKLATAEVRTAVETLPNEEFRIALARQMTDVYALLEPVSPREEPANKFWTARTLRYLLGAVANLAQQYDTKLSARYSANIMFFVPAGEDRQRVDFHLLQAIRFESALCRQNPDLVAGYLWLSRRLSASASLSAETDDALVPLALIVPAVDRYEGHQLILPGAPTAFRTAERNSERVVFEGVDNYREMKGLFVDEGVMAAISSFYGVNGPGRAIRSSLSLPLMRVDAEAGNGRREPFAVLNIYTDEARILGGSAIRMSIFASVLVPLVHEIARLCETWQRHGLAGD